MEHVQGESLQQRLNRDGPLPVEETIRIAEQVAEGLEVARPGIDSQGHQTCQHPRRSPHGQRQDHRFWFGSPGRRGGHHAQRRGRRNAAVHVPEQGRGYAPTMAATSSAWVACCTRCAPGVRRSAPTAPRPRWSEARDVAVPPVTQVNPAVPEWLGQIIDRLEKGPRAPHVIGPRGDRGAGAAAQRRRHQNPRRRASSCSAKTPAPSLPWRR